jgi:molybdopterin molybdotransferase
MVPFDTALASVLEAARPLAAEVVPCARALGRTLAEDVLAMADVPGHDNAAMDGFAVRAADVAGAGPGRAVRLRVAGRILAAARAPVPPLRAGEAYRIMTGAPIPAGADEVVEVERTRSAGEGAVEILAARGAGAQIRRRGEDLRRGGLALARGIALGPAELGLLASFGRAEVLCGRTPRVAILSTGDEVVPPEAAPREGEVRDANAAALAAAVRLAGGEPVGLGIARDDAAEIAARLARAEDCEVLLTSAGASRGDVDLVPALAERLGWRTLFREVGIKPGRAVAAYARGDRLLFALPGNPVAALVTFELLARPAVLRLQGRRAATRPEVLVPAPRAASEKPGRAHFPRVRLAPARAGGYEVAEMLPEGSGILRSMHLADALLRLEGEVAAGAPVRAVLLREVGPAPEREGKP